MISSKYFLVVQNNFTTAGVVGLYNSTENTAVYTVKGNYDKKHGLYNSTENTAVYTVL